MSVRESSLIADRQNSPLLTIGTFIDESAPRFPGRIHNRKGFGEDLGRDVEIALLCTAAIQPPSRRIFDTSHFIGVAVQSNYRARLDSWYKDTGIPFTGCRLRDVLRRLNHLQPQRIYDRLSFDDVQHPPHQPHRVTLPSRPQVHAWRHATFANLVVADRLPHLRTMEMTDPDVVWKRLMSLFRDYCTTLRELSFDRLSPKEQQREYISGYLAIYERLLFLWNTTITCQPVFIDSVLHRRPEPTLTTDPILALNDFAPTASLEEHLAVRHQAYLEMVQDLLHRSVDQLIRLTPRPNCS